MRVIYAPPRTLSLQINLAPGQQPEHMCWAGELPRCHGGQPEWKLKTDDILHDRSLEKSHHPPPALSPLLSISRSSPPDPGELRAGRAWFPKLSSYSVFFQVHIDKMCELGQINL